MIDEQLLDGLHEALGEVIADERKQWQRERALIEAQAQTTIERLHSVTVETCSGIERSAETALAQVKQAAELVQAEFAKAINLRLAELRDGADGAPGPAGPSGPAGPAGPRNDILIGEGAPRTLARAGAVYLDRSTGDLYQSREFCQDPETGLLCGSEPSGGSSSSGGGGKGGGKPVEGFSAGEKAAGGKAEIDKVKQDWFKASPFKGDTEAAMDAAKVGQDQLAAVGEAIAKKLGVKFNNPGPKTNMARIQQKANERGGIEKVSDLFRGGFEIDKPEQAAGIVAAIKKEFEVANEDWKLTKVNYTDKALQIRAPNGIVGEVQILEKKMSAAKKEGHKLYEQQRVLDPVKDKAAYDALGKQMTDLYGAVLGGYSPEWRAALGLKGYLGTGGKPGKAASKAALDITAAN